MTFVKLLVSFSPWIAFLLIAKGTLLRVEIGLVVALALSVVMALLRLHRGIVMWVGLSFFTATTIAVVGFHDLWTVAHLGVIAPGALALGSWAGLAVGQPFSLAYARQTTDPARWHDAVFIRTNVIITAIWASAFTINTASAWLLLEHQCPPWVSHTASYAALVGAAAFTSWYPRQVRRSAQTEATEREP